MIVFLKKIFLILLIVPVVFSCDQFLEETPDNRVDLNTVEKAAQLLTSGYPQASYNFTEWMSDNVSYTFGTFKQPEHNEAYNWEEVTAIFQDTPTYYWNSAYEAIAHANEVLASIDELEGDEARKTAVKGEALLVRAYNHFMLVNLFARHYDQQDSRNDPGVPYVKEPEKVFIKKYTRNTVREVYDLVESDLLEGLELVNDSYYANSGKYHFTRNAALAFASRYYLFRRDYPKCVQYSSQLLGSNPARLVKNIPALLSERINTEDYVRLYTSPTDESNLLLLRQATNFHVNVAYWPSNEMYNYFSQVNPFFAEDVRFGSAYVRGENGIQIPKFEFLFERSSLSSNVGINYTIALGFRGEEALLNRAESYALMGQIEDAIADLQVLVNYRYIDDQPLTLDIETLRNYYGIQNDDQFALFLFVLDEKQKEFLHEGLRWFDIRRYGIPVSHVLQDEQTVIELEQDDPRKVLLIPKAAVDVGGLEQNER